MVQFYTCFDLENGFGNFFLKYHVAFLLGDYNALTFKSLNETQSQRLVLISSSLIVDLLNVGFILKNYIYKFR